MGDQTYIGVIGGAAAPRGGLLRSMEARLRIARQGGSFRACSSTLLSRKLADTTQPGSVPAETPEQRVWKQAPL